MNDSCVILYEYSDFVDVLREKKRFRTYAELAHFYGVNQYYLWNMLNVEDYRPPKAICEVLHIRYYEVVPVCPSCHQAPTVCLCDGKKVIRKRGRKRAPRVEIAAGTPPDEVIRKLAAIGHQIHYVESEIDY